MWIYIVFILWCTSFSLMANGELRLLVIGGEVSQPMGNTFVRLIISDVELLDPFDSRSSCLKPPDLPFPRKCFVAENLGGNRPFIIGGGYTRVMYVTSLVLINNTWWNTPLELNHRRYCASSVQPEPNVMWVVGGDVDGANGGMTTEILYNSSRASQKYSFQNNELFISRISFYISILRANKTLNRGFMVHLEGIIALFTAIFHTLAFQKETLNQYL